MTRHKFGGDEWAITVNSSGDLVPAASAVLSFYTALTGGTQITDLLDANGNAATQITCGSDGLIPEFSGPASGLTRLAADAAGGTGPRRWMMATDLDTLAGVSLIAPSGDTTGAADTAAINGTLGTTPGAVARLGAGTFNINSDVLLRAAGQRLIGQGEGTTVIRPVNSGAAFTNAMVNITADKCAVRDLSFAGVSGTITTNTAVTAIQVNGAFETYIDSIFAQYINGWVVDLESTGSSTHFWLTNMRSTNTAGGVKLAGPASGRAIGCTMSNCGTAQVGVSTGAFANLDGLYCYRVTDITGVNCNFGAGSGTTGHAVHLLSVSNVYFSTFDMGGFPFPPAGGGQCGILIDGNSTDGNTGHVTFENGVLQTFDIGARVTGNCTNINFRGLNVGGNQTHGMKLDSGFASTTFIRDCTFGLVSGANGQATSGLTAGTQVYDLYWNNNSACRISGCEFNSAIVAANTNGGVQASIAVPSGNGTQFIYPRFTGTGATSGNWFTNTPANLIKF